jgi:hypothetical protein
VARKVIETLVDDISGDEIPKGAGKTIAFSIDGKSYEIDLSDKNAEKFTKALEPYISAARKTSASTATTPARATRAKGGAKATSRWSAGYATVRAWAQENGLEVSEKGRVADSVMQAYEDAHVNKSE